LTKVDTNGSKPAALKELIEAKAVDFIAMDIKSSRKGYEKAAGTSVDLASLEESIGLIKESGLDYEFRLTAVPGLHSEKDFLDIAEWLKGSKLFALQQFDSSVPLLDKEFQGKKSFSSEEMQKFAKILSSSIQEVKVRGI